MLVRHEMPLAAEIDALGAQPLVIRVPGEIRGKGRPRFQRLPNGAIRTYTDEKTERHENWIRSCAINQVGQRMLAGPLSLSVEITVAIPVSWSKRKQADAAAGLLRPTGRPDFDNTAKAICDALNKIVWVDDAQLVDVRVSKRYGAEPGAVLEVRTV